MANSTGDGRRETGDGLTALLARFPALQFHFSKTARRHVDTFGSAPQPEQRPTMQTMQQSTMKKLSPVIMVDAIEACIPFWERLGFTKTAEVPEGDGRGFVILAKDKVEVMYQ